MKILIKIFFIIIFSIIALTNTVNAKKFCSINSITNIGDEFHCDIISTVDTKSFFVVSNTNNDNNGTFGNLGIKTFNFFDLDYKFTEKKYINNNINTLAFLFKTEVYPNAP